MFSEKLLFFFILWRKKLMLKQVHVLMVLKNLSIKICGPGDPIVKKAGVKISATGETWSAPGAVEEGTNKTEIPIGTMRLLDQSFRTGPLTTYDEKFPSHFSKAVHAMSKFYKFIYNS
jgi:hypothetical protein